MTQRHTPRRPSARLARQLAKFREPVGKGGAQGRERSMLNLFRAQTCPPLKISRVLTLLRVATGLTALRMISPLTFVTGPGESRHVTCERSRKSVG